MPLLPCDLEPLCSLLKCVTNEENAISISRALMETYGSIERVFSCHISELKREIPGSEELKSKIAFYVETIKAITRRRRMEGFEIGENYNEAKVGKYLLGLYLFESSEIVYMLFFDKKMRYIGKELVSYGTVNTSHITIRRALETSLRHNASYVVLAHNHPLGKPSPSPDDISTTNNLMAAFTETGIKLLDHYIVSGASFTQLKYLSTGTLRQE